MYWFTVRKKKWLLCEVSLYVRMNCVCVLIQYVCVCVRVCVHVCVCDNDMVFLYIAYPPAFCEKDKLYCVSGVVQTSGLGSYVYCKMLNFLILQ